MTSKTKGGKKLEATLIKKFGSKEEVRKWRQKIGSKGGKNSNNTPFRDDTKLASRAGKISAEVRRKNSLEKK